VKIKRILIHTPDFPSWDGGISTMAYEYASELSRMGFEVQVVTLYRCKEDLLWDSSQPFKVHRMRNIKSSIAAYYYQVYKTYRFVTDFVPDLFISLRWDFSGLVGCALKGLGKYELLQFFHGNDIFSGRRKSSFWEGKFLKSIKGTDHIVSVSHFTDRLLKDTLSFDVDSYVNNLGVDINKFSPAQDVSFVKNELGLSNKKIILSLSRLVQRKGHEQVIKLLPKLSRVVPNILYVIAGKGSYEGKLRQLVSENKVDNLVVFTGFVSEEDKVKYYQACDVYVMLSETNVSSGDIEGFGLTYLEANACGKPVIAKREGGVIDAVQDGQNGFFIKNDIELLQKLSSLLADEEFYLARSKDALIYAKSRFSWRESTNNLVNIFSKN